MLDVVRDMETSDPDDFLTLLLLAGHPEVNLCAVTVTPGSPAQVGVVRLVVQGGFAGEGVVHYLPATASTGCTWNTG